MMKIGVLKENYPGEKRAALIPSDVARLSKLGAEVSVESGLGAAIRWTDEDYEKAGATILAERNRILSESDIVLRLRKPDAEEVASFRPSALYISYLDPFFDQNLLNLLADKGASAVSMELIPRSTRAQKMDALSSQASLSGYAAVILAAEQSDKILPMMTTPAGTISPARVFIIGAGVAGLQAIATAKRLGARVDAYDTRPTVAEQIRSLGAKFLEFDLGETGQTKDGYAKALTFEQMQKQREIMARQCALSDVVITTAQVFGKKAPQIITTEMVQGMKPGSIIVDLAIETGGNVECAQANQEVDINGVRVLAYDNLLSRVAVHASQMYSANLYNFIEEFWDKEKKSIHLNLEDDIIKSSLIVHEGKIMRQL